MLRILVIGGSGNVGRQVLAALPPARAHIRALARNPESVQFPQHVEIVRGDLTHPETLDAGLDGTDAVFLLWMAPPASVVPALERICEQARRVVFLSSPHKTPHPFFQQPNPVRVLHGKIERLIQDSGREWTFLRPGMLNTNALRWWAPQMRAGDVVRWPYLATPTSPIDERDIAAVAVRALCEDSHAGAEYILTGPESLTQRDQIATIGNVLGRRLRIQEMSLEEAQSEMLPFVPLPAIKMLCDAWAAGLGLPAFMTSTVEELTGRPARTWRNWAAENAAEFKRDAGAAAG